MAFLTVNRRGKATGGTTNATSWSITGATFTWTTNNAVPTTQTTRWYMFVSSDGNPTLDQDSGTSGVTWTKISQTSDATNAVTQAVFYVDTTASFAAGARPNFHLTSTASEQFSCELHAVTAASGKSVRHIVGTPASGSSTNANPPSITNNTGASVDFTVIAAEAGDSTTVASAAPTNYSNLVAQAGGGTNGSSIATADRAITVANAGSEDPGVFTTANDQWVTYTVGAYEYTPQTFNQTVNATSTPVGTMVRQAFKSMALSVVVTATVVVRRIFNMGLDIVSTLVPTRTALKLTQSRPTSDVSAGTWLPSTGTDLYAMVDEAVPYNDTDYIYATGTGTTVLQLPTVTNPGTTNGFNIVFRAMSDTGTRTLIVRLKQGATTISSRTETNVPATLTTFTYSIPPTDIANITDWTNLRLELEYA